MMIWKMTWKMACKTIWKMIMKMIWLKMINKSMIRPKSTSKMVRRRMSSHPRVLLGLLKVD